MEVMSNARTCTLFPALVGVLQCLSCDSLQDQDTIFGLRREKVIYLFVFLNEIVVDPLFRERFSKASLKSRLKKV